MSEHNPFKKGFDMLLSDIEQHESKVIEQQAERIKRLEQDLQTAFGGLQNCRLLAARHRNEDWALLILGFCAEAGEVGSVMR